MSFLYVAANGASIGIEGGHIRVKYQDGKEEYVPKETVEGISIFGKSQMSSSCIQHCLENDISVSYFTQSGRYYGGLSPAYKTRISRLKKQIQLTEDEEFSLGLAKKMIYAKVSNQLVVAKRYMHGKDYDKKERLFHLRNAKRKIPQAESFNQLMGYEGIAARSYFHVLSSLIESEFRFTNRNRRPSTDPFNCMLGFGYSLLTKEICGEIENRGMSAFAGFLHKDREKHPALASDMIEEWRPIIVDSVVMSLIQGHEIKREMFSGGEDDICKMSLEAIKIMLVKMEKRMHSQMSYLSYFSTPVTFREAIWYQAEHLGKAIDCGDYEIYKPVCIR